jgi:putative ABC transport system permease protein
VFWLAVRNLVQNKTRLAFSVGGVGLALTLVLFFEAVVAGATGRFTVYIDNAGADLWVSQQGVRTMHMSASTLPASAVNQVSVVSGVEDAEGILYSSDAIRANGDEYLTYVFGLSADASMGRPPGIIKGKTMPEPGEVIIDSSVARQAGVGLGDSVTVLGRQMRIAGLTSGTSSITSSVTIITKEDFVQASGQGEVVSFVLVRVKEGEAPATVSGRLREQVSGITVQTSAEFATEERKLVKDMSADILTIMNTAGFVTGLAVVALTVYIATIGRRREYGVLKAMGVRNSRLYQIVVVQALLSVAFGLIAGLGLTLLLAATVPRFNELLVLSISAGAVMRVGLVSVLLAGLAALLPARQLAGLEPVAIIRRG